MHHGRHEGAWHQQELETRREHQAIRLAPVSKALFDPRFRPARGQRERLDRYSGIQVVIVADHALAQLLDRLRHDRRAPPERNLWHDPEQGPRRSRRPPEAVARHLDQPASVFGPEQAADDRRRPPVGAHVTLARERVAIVALHAESVATRPLPQVVRRQLDKQAIGVRFIVAPHDRETVEHAKH